MIHLSLISGLWNSEDAQRFLVHISGTTLLNAKDFRKSGQDVRSSSPLQRPCTQV